MKAITLPLLFIVLVGVAHAELKVVPQSSNSTEVIQTESPKPEIPSGKFQAAVQIDGEFVDKVADKVKEIPLKEIKDSVISSAHAAKGLVKSLIAEIPRPAAPTASPSPTASEPINKSETTGDMNDCPPKVADIDSAFNLAKTYDKKVIIIVGNDKCFTAKQMMLYISNLYDDSRPHSKLVINPEHYIICYVDTINAWAQYKLFKDRWGYVPSLPTAKRPGHYPLVLILDQAGVPMDKVWDQTVKLEVLLKMIKQHEKETHSHGITFGVR